MGELSRLVFTSRSTLCNDEPYSAADIVAQGRRNNGLTGLTGALVFHKGAFAQVLEGPRREVEAAFGRIRHDQRHADIRILADGPAVARCFPNEPMAFVTSDTCNDPALDTLLAHAAVADGGRAEDVAERVRDVVQARRMAGQGLVNHPTGEGGVTEANPGGGHQLDVLEAMFATCVFSASGRLVRANPGYAALFGLTQDEVLGRRRQDLAQSWDGEGLDYGALWAGLRAGEPSTITYQARRTDGCEVWVRGHLHPLLEQHGRLGCVVEVATDISERMRLSAEEHGQVAAINAALGVVHFAVDGTILQANDRFLDAVGYTLEEVQGRSHRMFVDPAEASSQEYAAFWAALASGQHRTAEFKRIGRDGREVWLQATYNPIVAPNGRVMKVIKYATDVTLEKLRQAEFQWQVAAIHKSHAVASFTMDGLILDANQTFLDALGYELDQIVGRHHRLFVDPSYAHGGDYAAFWRELGQGRHQAGVYRRLDSSGREVWLQANYNPIFDPNGRPVKVIKYATLVTEEKLRQAEHQGQIAAIHKAQCVIAFGLDGTILDANDNFLDALGYRLSEVRGRHHRMLVEPAYGASAEYAAFWAALAAGRHQVAEFKRIRKDGSEVWLQATYNPILDMAGRPIKVVKYATDVTRERLQQADFAGQIEAIRKSQGVISFDMDGVILDANDRFLETVGYGLDELRGQHHRMLVTPDDAASAEYAAFWETLRDGRFVSGLYRRLGKDGREVWIQASYNPILDLNGRPFKIVKFATDVTSNVALSEAYEDAKRQAQHDPATALPNRVRLASFMAKGLAAPNRRLTVLYLDLDRFKPINDTHGHQVGDRVLGEVADRLRRQLSFDQLAARVGGDEFVVVA